MQQRCLEFLYYISSCFLKRNYDQTKKPFSLKHFWMFSFLWVGICIELLVLIFVFSYSAVCFWCLIKILKPKSMGLWYQWILGKCIFGEILVMFCFAFSTSAFEVELLKLWFYIQLFQKTQTNVYSDFSFYIKLLMCISHSRVIVDFCFPWILPVYRQFSYTF